MRNQRIGGSRLTYWSVSKGKAGALCLLSLFGACAILAQEGSTTERVSLSSSGEQGNGSSGGVTVPSLGVSMSGDGRYVVFESNASNLVVGDTNNVTDVFVRDRTTGMTERLSISTGGTQANGASYQASISADGRFIAFTSQANNLVQGDTNASTDVFVRDRLIHSTSRASVSTAGTQGNSLSDFSQISANGRFVVFESFANNLIASDTNGHYDVFVRDLIALTTTRVSLTSAGGQCNGSSYYPSVSADGRWVAYASVASNIVSGDLNGTWDVFLSDRQSGVTTRVSAAPSGGDANAESNHPTISADGRFVAFESVATNLVAADTNGFRDIFLRDRILGSTERLSVSSAGTQGNGDSLFPSISADGMSVAFESVASTLVPNDSNGSTDVFVRDRSSGITARASISSAGAEANQSSSVAKISPNATYVSFQSNASNLVVGDTNLLRDVFLHDRGTSSGDTVTTLTASPPIVPANGASTSSLTLSYRLNGLPAAGYTVKFHSSRGGLDSFSETQVVVNGQGIATTQISSTTPGYATITVQDVGTSQTLPATAGVTFTSTGGGSGGPTIDRVTSTYEGEATFVKDVSMTNTVDVVLSSQGAPATRVDFTLNGQTRTVNVIGMAASTSYDTGRDFQYDLHGRFNVLTITAYTADGTASQSATRMWKGITLPESLSPDRWISGRDGRRFEFSNLNGETRIKFAIEWPASDVAASSPISNALPLMNGTRWGQETEKFVAEIELKVRSLPFPENSYQSTVSVEVGRAVEHKYNLPGRRPKHKLSVASVSAELEGKIAFSFQLTPELKLLELKASPQVGLEWRTPDLMPMLKPELSWLIDLYGKLRVEAGGDISFWDSVSNQFTFKLSNPTLKIALSVVAELDEWAHAVGNFNVEGGVALTTWFDFPGKPSNPFGNEFLQKISVDIFLQAYIAVNVCGFDWEFDLADLNGHFEAPSGGKGLAAGRPRQGRWVAPHREYLHGRTAYHQPGKRVAKHPFQPWLDKAEGVAMRGGGNWDVEETQVQTNVFPSMKPQLAWDADQAVIVYAYDDASLPDHQNTEIRALHQDGTNWVEKTITDDTELDSLPTVVTMPSGDLIAAWCRTVNVLVSDTPAQRYEKCEIAFSKFDRLTGVWSTPSLVTSDTQLDINPRLVVGANGQVYLTWLKCPDGVFPVAWDVPSIPHTDFMTATWNGSTFVPTGQPVARVDTVDRVAFAVSETGTALAVWSKDKDDDPQTRDDALYWATNSGAGWSSPLLVSGEALPQVSPAVAYVGSARFALFYGRLGAPNPDQPDHKAALIKVTNLTGGVWAAPIQVAVTNTAGNLDVLATPSGKVNAIWTTSSEKNADVWTTLYDPVFGAYSDPIRLTDDAARETQLALAWDATGDPSAAYLKVNYDQQIRTISSGGNTYEVLANVPISSDLYLLAHRPRPDLTVSSFELSPSNAGPGEAVELQANVGNLRGKGATGVKVAFYDGDPDAGGVVIGTVDATPSSMPGGTTAAATLSWTVPTGGFAHTLYAKVDPLLAIVETDETNNVASRKLAALDFAALSPAPKLYLPDGKVALTLSFENRSSVASYSSVDWQLWEGEPGTGTLLTSGQSPSAVPGGQATIEYTWDPGPRSDGDYPLTFVVDPNQLLPDGDRTDDKAEGLIALRPDIVVNPYDAEVVPGSNGTNTVSVTIMNLGWSGATNIPIKVLDGPPGSGSVLGSQTIGSMNRGETARPSITIGAIPTTGVVWITADPDGTITEVRKDNNFTAWSSVFRTLTVTSRNPDTGVTINVTTDRNGQGAGTTTFTRTYNLGTHVIVNPPGQVGSKLFDHLEVDGAPINGPLIMDADHTVTAVYVNGYSVAVSSSNPNAGVPIQVWNADFYNRRDGNTAFSRIYKEGRTVAMTAPASAGGNWFDYWQVDGVRVPGTSRTITLTMNQAHTAKAVFATSRTLTVRSTNPTTGVPITVWLADKLNQKNGVTEFIRQYAQGASVPLTAPQTVGTSYFQRWDLNGSPWQATGTVTVPMSANQILTAVYAVGQTVTVTSSEAAVPITVWIRDRAGLGNGTTSFTRLYPTNTLVSFTCPATANGKAFVRWEKDGVAVPGTSRTLKFSTDTPHTVRAVYSQ